MFKSLARITGFINAHPLAKKHLLKAYLRFIKWQFQSSLLKKEVKFQFIENTKFWAKKGLTGITGNIYSGLHEFEDMSFLIHFLRENDVFFDVGANVGSYTILASGLKRAKTIAFEPILKSYNFLRKNVSLNLLEDQVICEQMAVGAEEKVLFFTTNQDTTNHMVTIPDEHSSETKVVPLDKYFPTYSPILMKIDVEGFETEVLNGAKIILENTVLKAIIIELNGSGDRYGYNEEEIHKKLLHYSFIPYNYSPRNRTLNQLDGFGSYNTIYIRDVDFVEKRLKSAPSFLVFGEKI